jgi:hypothetical protein
MAPLGEEKSARTAAGTVLMETNPNQTTLQKDYISPRIGWQPGVIRGTGVRTDLAHPPREDFAPSGCFSMQEMRTRPVSPIRVVDVECQVIDAKTPTVSREDYRA